jgi:crotonobetainyl-CoA:carnitine CoA-transferase CaiB-like acyl-CoA transferase
MTNGSEPWLPLAGVRVVDFSMFVPGPFASSILADLGAEVIKVEPPRGDPGRSYAPPQFHTENRNKRSIAIDLKHADSRAVVEKLVKQAQVVVEGFRPGVAKRLGIDFDALRKINGQLVYCSLSGYGQTGPWRERPGHDINYVAAAGGLAFPGQWLKAPARASLPIADMAGGAFAAVAILAALREGQGAYLDLSLFEAAFFLCAMRHGLDPAADPRAHIWPVNDVFETSDGKRLTLGILEEHFWQNFAKLAPELADDRFSSDKKRRANGDELSRVLEAPRSGSTSARKTTCPSTCASRRPRRRSIRSWSSARRPSAATPSFPYGPTAAAAARSAPARRSSASTRARYWWSSVSTMRRSLI